MGFAGRERIVFSAISSCMTAIDSIRCPTVDRGRKPLKMSKRESLVKNSNILVEVNREGHTLQSRRILILKWIRRYNWKAFCACLSITDFHIKNIEQSCVAK